MRIAVTGATGHLGRLAIDHLISRGTPASSIIAIGRSVDRIADLAERGVDVRAADYNDTASLDAAFAGADRLLLISGSEVGSRVTQHQRAVDAAVRAGIGFIAYTSISNVETSATLLAGEHRATEALIAASGIPAACLRNSWYVENYTAQLPTYLEHGIAGAAGDGRVSAATRADYAEAAAVVIGAATPETRAWELGGTAFTLAELAAEISAQSGRPVAYHDLPEAAFRDLLVSVGLPEPVATVFADADRGLSEGDLEVTGSDLADLIGHAPTTLADAISAALAQLATPA